MAQAKELRAQSVNDLETLCVELSKEIFQIKNELSITRKIEKPHLLKLKKKERAKVLTVLGEKKRG